MEHHLLNFGRPKVAPTAAQAALAGAMSLANANQTQTGNGAVPNAPLQPLPTDLNGNPNGAAGGSGAIDGASSSSSSSSSGAEVLAPIAAPSSSSSGAPEVLSVSELLSRGPPTSAPPITLPPSLQAALAAPTTLAPLSSAAAAAAAAAAGELSNVLMCMNAPDFLEEDDLRRLLEPFGSLSEFR